MYPLSDFDQNKFICDTSNKLVKDCAKNVTKLLEKTPPSVDLNFLEMAVFVRITAYLSGKTELRHDLTENQYRDMHERIERCFRDTLRY